MLIEEQLRAARTIVEEHLNRAANDACIRVNPPQNTGDSYRYEPFDWARVMLEEGLEPRP